MVWLWRVSCRCSTGMSKQGCKTSKKAGQVHSHQSPTETVWQGTLQLPAMVYHSLVLLRKVFQNQKPEYLYQKITAGAPQRNTRQSLAIARTLAAAGVLSQPSSPSCDLSLTRCWSAVHWHTQIPPSLRSEKSEKTFKTKLKSWVSENVENLLEVDWVQYFNLAILHLQTSAATKVSFN